ncbi:hypothetical protein AK812_SmicGene40762, partial [Symbiodinium microadriaticum]
MSDQCVDLFCEGDPAYMQEQYQMVWKGEGKGSYSAAYKEVEHGRGEWEKVVVNHKYTSYRPKVCCMCLVALLLLALLGYLLYHLLHERTTTVGADDMSVSRPAQDAIDCDTGFYNYQVLWDADKRAICCDLYGRACGGSATVVHHPHFVYHGPPAQHYNCRSGYSNWLFGWSQHKKAWCCSHESRGCPGTWHGSYHLHMHVGHHVGHAVGHIYDCDAGFSNWMQGWSDSKKDWCCSHEQKGCVKYHCTGDDVPWALERETDTCKNRIHWTRDHVFGDKENKCSLAYSKVQVECEAGCEVHIGSGSLPFDCNAAINNFFRVAWPVLTAWSPEKKHWCCTKQGKGCEGHHPPSVDAGYGMVWKHVQVNGYWTWMAVHGHGQSHASLPYDCNAGRANWHTGWSGGKKATKSCVGNSGKLAFASSRSRHGAVSTNMSAATEVGQARCCRKLHTGCLAEKEPRPSMSFTMCTTAERTTVRTSDGSDRHMKDLLLGLDWLLRGHGAAFDCHAGFSRWHTAWSPAKKADARSGKQPRGGICPCIALLTGDEGQGARTEKDHWRSSVRYYVGASRGSYEQRSEMRYIGAGMGEWNKEEKAVYTRWRLVA